jgi:ribosomal protein S18 acetylase RimI-like enzyme
MGTNQTPHFAPAEHSECRSGGSLKDGWSYLMPTDEFVLGAEVSVAFSDELEEHVLEQTQALKALYLHSSSSGGGADSEQPQFQASKKLQVEQEQPNKVDKGKLLFVVKRGLQVVGVATYSQDTGFLTDVAVRPSAKGDEIGATLMNAVKSHARKLGRSGSLIVQPRSHDSKSLFESMGFSQVDDDDKNDDDHVGAAKMESKIN